MTASARVPSEDSPRRADGADLGVDYVKSRSISVVIAAHSTERWPDTVEAIASALKQEIPPHEVILVVDHNAELATQAKTGLTGLTVIESTGPRGASATRNTGVQHSTGEIVVFLDDDQVADSPRWLYLLCRHFQDSNVTGVGGGITPSWSGIRPRWFPREFDWVVGASYAGMPDSVSPVRNVWGGNTAMRRSAFDAVGGFRPGFGKTGNVSRPEDTDLCLRVQEALPSGHWLYDPAAEVAHKVPAARSTPMFFVKRCWNEGRGKAALVNFGASASMTSERDYASQVLPGAFLRELRHGFGRLDVASLARSGAILVGFIATGAGWLAEMALTRERRVT